MIFIPRDDPFTCKHCGANVAPLERGTYRNHCPRCLRSRHVDLEGPGDRANPCGGLMDPIGLDSSGKKGFILLHRCRRCSAVVRNKAASDDDLTVLPGEGT
jgi:DNA-directed RNA polymerase subunit RPC12/RpoP